MHSLPFMLGALCVLAIAYRYYSAFIAKRRRLTLTMMACVLIILAGALWRLRRAPNGLLAGEPSHA